MASSESGEVAIPIETLISTLTKGFTSAAELLRNSMSDDSWKRSPFIYHMPSMTLEVRLALSYSDGKVSGIFKRSKSETTQEVTSTMKLDIVAVPNPLQLPGGG